ncbi:SOS response-associated peptidase [Bacillus sp. NEB1478]|uniref:SOS response-associated peptidase n=1 Tax=Bacillus sp. NEB1478 TaxID=3073816 RepID=UPI002873C826|nr:SOS response-associated peptidase [Bacillus sp. NEB1478]WNB90753.1 SOS response-associated peptidase [Bacillus sp. NEB1478]
MCGRYMLYYEKDVIIDAFNLINEFDYEERYNIAPSQQILAIVKSKDGNRAGNMQWGLIPNWAKDPKIGNKLINARSETVNEKPSFKESFINKRCLIPASGFYEWRKEGSKKQPYLFCLPDKRPFAFAGIWSRWKQESDGRTEEKITCSILTKKANASIEDYHDRMPVMFLPDEGEEWLNKTAETKRLIHLIDQSNFTLFSEAVTLESPAKQR